MEFREWLKQYVPEHDKLDPSALALIELGWIGGKTQAHTERLDAFLHEEQAA